MVTLSKTNYLKEEKINYIFLKDWVMLPFSTDNVIASGFSQFWYLYLASSVIEATFSATTKSGFRPEFKFSEFRGRQFKSDKLQ